MDMLFERFISKERDEPPDIDVDFEHERREKSFNMFIPIMVKYAALAATVINIKQKVLQRCCKALAIPRR